LCINSHQMDIQDVIDVFEKNSIPVYTTPERAAKALSGLVRYGRLRLLDNYPLSVIPHADDVVEH